MSEDQFAKLIHEIALLKSAVREARPAQGRTKDRDDVLVDRTMFESLLKSIGQQRSLIDDQILITKAQSETISDLQKELYDIKGSFWFKLKKAFTNG